MILLVNLTDIISQYIGHGAFVLISVLTPVIIFLCFKKRIGRSGEAEINGILHFNLDSKKLDIKIDNIDNYKVEYNQGIVFKIKIRNGNKIKITANRDFFPGVVYAGLGIGIVAWTDYFKTKRKFSKSKGLNSDHLRS